MNSRDKISTWLIRCIYPTVTGRKVIAEKFYPDGLRTTAWAYYSGDDFLGANFSVENTNKSFDAKAYRNAVEDIAQEIEFFRNREYIRVINEKMYGKSIPIISDTISGVTEPIKPVEIPEYIAYLREKGFVGLDGKNRNKKSS